MQLLKDTCESFQTSGHLLYFKHDTDCSEDVIVLDESALLKKIHGSLKQSMSKLAQYKFGILEKSFLTKILMDIFPSSTMSSDMAIKYLQFSQLCTEVRCDKLMMRIDLQTTRPFYFFPNLFDSETQRPDNSVLWNTTYTNLSIWCLKCSQNQFFTPQFVHALFIQLIHSEYNDTTKVSLWKNGILLVFPCTTRCVVEVTSQTKKIYLVMQCHSDHKIELVQRRSKLIALTRSLKEKICPKHNCNEYLFIPQMSYPPTSRVKVTIDDLACCAIHSYPSVIADNETKTQILISDLLHFDIFHTLSDGDVQSIIKNYKSDEKVPLYILDELPKEINLSSQLHCTYRELYGKISSFTIFPANNFYALASKSLCAIEEIMKINYSSHDKQVISLDDLFKVNSVLAVIYYEWKKFGSALGLSNELLSTINEFSPCERRLTEVLANWLKRSCNPTWGNILKTLYSVMNLKELARQLSQKLHDNSFFNDDDPSSTQIEPGSQISLKELHHHVRNLDYKWFHIGLALGLKYDELKVIEGNEKSLEYCMYSMLQTVLRTSESTTLQKMAGALETTLVGERRLAKSIRNQK